MLSRFIDKFWKKKDFSVSAEEIDAAVSFTNMTGYVGIAEKMPLKLLPEFMKQYFEVNCSVIQKYQGCIDKFEGDKIMAFWGLNQTPEQSAQLACESAVSQMEEMEKFYAWAKKNGHPCPKIRIGISTGPVIMGNMGSKTILDFTVMGACVSTAATLQDAAKHCDSAILVDENTRNYVTDVKFDDLVNVAKGNSMIKAFPIKI